MYSTLYSNFRPYTATFYTEKYTAPIHSKFDRRLIPRARPQMSQTTATFLAKHELSS